MYKTKTLIKQRSRYQVSAAFGLRSILIDADRVGPHRTGDIGTAQASDRGEAVRQEMGIMRSQPFKEEGEEESDTGIRSVSPLEP